MTDCFNKNLKVGDEVIYIYCMDSRFPHLKKGTIYKIDDTQNCCYVFDYKDGLVSYKVCKIN